MPKFNRESIELVNVLRKYSPKKLRNLMKVSSDITELNVERYKNWLNTYDLESGKQAILTFTGEVYNGLDAGSFSEQDVIYSQERLRILSGLYGVLKPLDLIQEYRLEMGTKLKVKKYMDLYGFWGDKIVNELNDSLKTHVNKTIVNLASNEYYKSVNIKKITSNVVTPIFKDEKNGEYKMVMVYAKKARGLMARYIIKNQIENAKDLVSFTENGYYFKPQLSNEKELIFYRG